MLWRNADSGDFAGAALTLARAPIAFITEEGRGTEFPGPLAFEAASFQNKVVIDVDGVMRVAASRPENHTPGFPEAP